MYEPDQIQAARLNLERAIQSVLGEERIDEAEQLSDSGMYRAAAAILGVFLEHILRQLQAKYAQQLDTRSGKRPLGTWSSNGTARRRWHYETGDIQPVQRAIEIRNRAVHDLAEPTAQDVQFMLRVVREFKTKYLG